MSVLASQNTNELKLVEQKYGENPQNERTTDLYKGEYITSFVDKWDQLIDWQARAESEGSFFIDVLRSRNVKTVLDAATGTGFHSVRLIEAGFDVTSVDGSAAMLGRAFENAKARGHILKTLHADWRWLSHSVHQRFDAIVCLGNSFTHIHDELDRRRALVEFYSALTPSGILILDQRNYDYMLENGFKSKHKFYYCGNKVKAEPLSIADDLVRFQYTFPDESIYTLNLHPIKRDYTRKLLRESGYLRIRTYGDFEAAYDSDESDFFIHVAEKSELIHLDSNPIRESSRKLAITEDYYNSDDADAFYSTIWGGEDLHLGIYTDTDNILDASNATVDLMAIQIPEIAQDTRILDLGSGYGGSARRLVEKYGCKVVGLNLSKTQNDRNILSNQKHELSEHISVVHGNFEDIPASNDSYDIVWSQDSFLHSNNRNAIIAEAYRVLKPGGQFIFTDPLQSDTCDKTKLTEIYNRLDLTDLASYGSYEKLATLAGFEVEKIIDLSDQLPIHFTRIHDELIENRIVVEEGASKEYIDNMLVGLRHWIDGGNSGNLAWGIIHLRKPR